VAHHLVSSPYGLLLIFMDIILEFKVDQFPEHLNLSTGRTC
jgi:hypothetical protein